MGVLSRVVPSEMKNGANWALKKARKFLSFLGLKLNRQEMRITTNVEITCNVNIYVNTSNSTVGAFR